MSKTLETLPFSDGHPVKEYIRTLDSETSRRSQWSAIQQCVPLLQKRASTSVYAFQWDAVSPQDLARLRSRLVGRYKPSTARRYLAAVRGVLESAYILGMLDGDRYARLTHRRALRPIRGESAPPGRALSIDETDRLLAVCGADPSHLGARDAALLASLIGCGLRRVEAVGLDLSDVDLPGRTLTVQGKGRRERRVPIPPGTASALVDWIAARGAWAGPLFNPLGREGADADSSGKRISLSAVPYVLARRAQQAGLDRLTVHDLRRTYVSGLLDRDVGLDTCARLAGHKRLDTTARYDRHGEARARMAGESVPVPYTPTSRPTLRPLEG